MSKTNVVVIAAHPDDELLGCGGTLARLADEGHQVTAIIACEGESWRYGEEGVGQVSHIEKAAKILGIGEIRHFKLPDQRLETLPQTDIITPIEEVLREVKPGIVFVQYGGDVNSDHQMLFKAALVATRPTEEFIELILAFDTASSTEWAYPRSFVPDTWVDISPYLDRKLEAMACYESEVRDYPHPRSIKGLEYKARAYGNQCCLDAAEAFMTIRRILRHGQASL